MIDFEGYYHFAPEQVESIDTETRQGESSYPYTLAVYLKSGRKLAVNYPTKKARDNAREVLCRRVETALRQDADRFYSRLYLVEDAVKRIDKRQLRIWRQLKALLQLATNEDEEE